MWMFIDVLALRASQSQSLHLDWKSVPIDFIWFLDECCMTTVFFNM